MLLLKPLLATFSISISVVSSFARLPEDGNNGVDARQKSTCRESPLHIAVRNNDRSAAREQLSKGADKYSEDCNGRTPMHVAVLEAPRMIYQLVEGRFDVNRRFSGGNTTLMYAVHRASKEAVKLLVKYGAMSHLENDLGSTPFLEAALLGKKQLMELLKHRSGINVKLSDGRTYLHRAVGAGNIGAVLNLLALGAELEVRDAEDRTPLTYAVERNDVALANILIYKGSDVWAQSKEGLTYLHVAVKSGSHDCLRTLLEVGLPADAKNSEGVSALSLAVGLNDSEATRILQSARKIPVTEKTSK